MTDQATKYSYSVDEEIYHDLCDTADEAALVGFEAYPDAGTVWVGEAIAQTAHRFVSADRLLEEMQQGAFEEAGESAEDWLVDLARDQQKCASLEKLIGDFIQEQDPPKFWTITDIREFNRADVGLGPVEGE